MKKAIVVGGGIAGCTISYLLEKNGWKVTLLEKESYLGGGFKTFYYGGHPYTLGPRPLFSRNEEETRIFEFINGIIPLRKLEHSLLTYVEQDGAFYSYPIHKDDVPKMPDAELVYSELEELKSNPPKEPTNFEEFWIASVGKTLYDKFINSYSKKMWQIKSNTELKEFKWSPKGATLKSGPRNAHPNSIVAYPYAHDGYDEYFSKCTEDVEVHLCSPPEVIDVSKKRVKVKNEWLAADILVNTISLDDFMGYCFGELPYIGRDFIKLVLPIEEVLPGAIQYLFYPGEEEFLRVVEYKKLTFYKAPTTLLVMEIPSSNGKLYPLPFPEPKAIAQRYLDALPENVYTLGRLGTYTYNIDMEGITLQAFELIERLK